MKVAIVGTGVGYDEAPWNDESWEIWTICGTYKQAKRVNRVYEIHSAQALNGMKIEKEKFEWMLANVNVTHPSLAKTFKDARIIDFEGLMKKFGNYFTSSISWMMAEAINEKAKEIALYGITLSSNEEYAHQKPSCSYLIGWAKAMGIKVTCPKMSELLSAPYVYGYQEIPDFIKSMSDRKLLAERRKADAQNQLIETEKQISHCEGYLEGIEYFENNWWSASK